MVLVYTCLNGFRFIFHFLCWYLSSEKRKIRKIPTYNLSIISLSCLRGIISSPSFPVNPDNRLLSLFIFFLLAVFTFIMVLLSPFSCSTPSDTSYVLEIHPQFEGATLGFQSDTTAFDATLLLEDPFLSAARDSGLGHSLTTTTSKESPSDVRLLDEPPAGKPLDVLDFAFDSSLAAINLG